MGVSDVSRATKTERQPHLGCPCTLPQPRALKLVCASLPAHVVFAHLDLQRMGAAFLLLCCMVLLFVLPFFGVVVLPALPHSPFWVMLLVSLSAREEGGGGEERKREKGSVRREEGRRGVRCRYPPLLWPGAALVGVAVFPRLLSGGGASCFLKN